MQVLFDCFPYSNTWGSKNKHHKDTCSNEIGLCLPILSTTPRSINSEHNWEDLCIPFKKWTNMITISSEVQFPIRSSLMQHRFRCVNAFGRSWRAWQTNWITPTYHLREVCQTYLLVRAQISHQHNPKNKKRTNRQTEKWVQDTWNWSWS
jgi:hypothetical protein